MKAVIYLDVPEWQIGQEVDIYFRDTMKQHGICEEDKNNAVPIKIKHGLISHWATCGRCGKELIPGWIYCPVCGKELIWDA